MNELIELIQDELNIPCLDPADPVLDGCFFCMPFLSSGIGGNGRTLEFNDYVAVDIFYSDKDACMRETKKLCKALSDNGYIIQSVSYEYEEDAEMLHAAMNIIIIGGTK